jgi:superoxide reductase
VAHQNLNFKKLNKKMEVIIMAKICEVFQEADWKQEKHVPVISAPEAVKKDEPMNITVTVGKEIAHPNTTEHHIAWISVFFKPEGEKFPHTIGRFNLGAHGASAEGPNTSTIYTDSEIVCKLKTSKPGTLMATSCCNIHGLWSSSKQLNVE